MAITQWKEQESHLRKQLVHLATGAILDFAQLPIVPIAQEEIP
jgi:hypothetical protein